MKKFHMQSQTLELQTGRKGNRRYRQRKCDEMARTERLPSLTFRIIIKTKKQGK